MSTTYHIHEILSFVLQELVEEKEDQATANFRNELSLTDGVDIHTLYYFPISKTVYPTWPSFYIRLHKSLVFRNK